MESDLDLFDDIFSDGTTKKARGGTMFQPKAKPRPRKQSSASVTSINPVQVVDLPQNELPETCETGKPSQSIDIPSGIHSSRDHRSSLVIPVSEHIASSEVVDPITGLHPGIASSGNSIEKSAGESADIFLGLESLDDFLCQPATLIVNTENSSPVVAGMTPQMENKLSSSCPASVKTTLPCLESEALHVSDTSNPEEGFDIPVASLNDNSVRQLEAFPSMDNLDIVSNLTSRSGLTGKFQPKPKVKVHAENCTPSVNNLGTVGSLSYLQDAQAVPSEAEQTNEGPILVLPSDDILELSPTRFSDSIPMDPTSELPETEEPTHFNEIYPSGATIPEKGMEADPEIHSSQRDNAGKTERPILSNVSAKHQGTSMSSQELGLGRSLRQQKKRRNACQPINESDDGAVDAGDLPPESSCGNEDNSNVKESELENESNKKRRRRNLNKPMVEKEKPVQKHKKANKISEQSTKEQPKRFRHSTSQKRRRVDKSLLDIPEDERQNLPLKDRILLWEYSERIMKKEAATSETPVYHSTGNPTAYYNEDQAFASDLGGLSNEEQTNTPVQEESLTCFNYQTFMNKTPRVTWSKQETELFYEAVQQFGTDLSLIQQLFPGRTRRQIKLKYKKEERQQPLRLREAITSRAKDHSHYKLVIERLQQAAPEEFPHCNMDDSVDLTGEEETTEINEEDTKTEQVEEEPKVMEPLVPEVQSPVNSVDSGDDLFRWSQYKCAVAISSIVDILLQGWIIGAAGKLPDRNMQANVAGTAAPVTRNTPLGQSLIITLSNL